LRAKIVPDETGVPIDWSFVDGWEAESAVHGETTCKDDNEVWHDFAATRRDGAPLLFDFRPGFGVAYRSTQRAQLS